MRAYRTPTFPFLGVRFISVNDDFDTFAPDFDNKMLAIQLKAIMHDYYCKNLGFNIKSVCDSKREKGLYLGAKPPYGYKFADGNRYKLVPNEETAPIIKQIFKWKLDGLPCSQIADRLNNTGVLSPTNYLYSKGILKHEKYRKKVYWIGVVVKRILANPAYIGTIAQGKEINSVGVRKQNIPPIWVVKNTHEPIISKSDFEAVQKLLQQTTARCKAKCTNSDHL